MVTRTLSRADSEAEKSDRRSDLDVYSPSSSSSRRDPLRSSHSEPNYGEEEVYKKSIPMQIIDSFRRDRNAYATPDGVVGANGRVFDPDETGHAFQPRWAQKSVSSGRTLDLEAGARRTANSGLQRNLKGRHLQMIAIGGSIGTGLFVASGKALAKGGPASLLISFGLIGTMLFCTVQALGELAVVFPVAGSFSAYSTRFLDPAWGFAMGWNYAMQWLVVLPLEVIAASITIDFWNDSLPHAVFVTIFLFLIISINLFGVKGYGEAEFCFAIIKIVAVIGFILLGIVINIGGGPDGGYIGGAYWKDPGAFNNGFKGLCSTFVTAAFAFAGTELVGLAAAETQNPRKSLPTAVKQVFWRITIFYIVSLAIIGLDVKYTDQNLLTDGDSNTAASPFVIAIRSAGIDVLPSIMNIVILIAVLSVGNSAVFGSSRTLAALADQGQAPRILGYIDRKGRPLVAISIASSIGFIAYAADSGHQVEVLSWLLALSGLSSIFTWGSICLAHIRFRKAWKQQGRTLDELAFRSQPGTFGSWIGFIFNLLVLVAQFWTGFWPVGYEKMTLNEQARSFFLAYLAAPIVLIFYIVYKIWYRTPFMRCADMDLHTGMRELNVKELRRSEAQERAHWPKWKKLYKYIC